MYTQVKYAVDNRTGSAALPTKGHSQKFATTRHLTANGDPVEMRFTNRPHDPTDVLLKITEMVATADWSPAPPKMD